MRKSYYVKHKLLRYAKNVLRYAAIITLCVVITLCGVTSEQLGKMWSDKATGPDDQPIEAVKVLAKQDIMYVVEAMNQVLQTTTRNPINMEEEQHGADIQRKRKYTRVQ